MSLHRNRMVPNAVCGYGKFFQGIFHIVLAFFFYTKVFKRCIARFNMKKFKAAIFNPQPLCYRNTIHGVGITEGDDVTICNPEIKSGITNLQNLNFYQQNSEAGSTNT